MNRNYLFRQFVENLPGWREGRPGERVQLGHWDVYKVGPIDSEFEVWPRSCTNVLDNIATFYQRVQSHGMEQHFAETIFDWRNLDRAIIESSPLWLLKNVWSIRSEGLMLVRSFEDYRRAVDEHERRPTQVEGPDGLPEDITDMFVLQRGITNCHLVDSCKYRLRMYYLTLGDGRVYLYNDGLGYPHPTRFDPRSSDRAVHLSLGVTYNFGGVESPTSFTLSDKEFYRPVLADIVARSRESSVIWSDVASRCAARSIMQFRCPCLTMDLLTLLSCGAAHSVTQILLCRRRGKTTTSGRATTWSGTT
jgi:hypothetical protein